MHYNIVKYLIDISLIVRLPIGEKMIDSVTEEQIKNKGIHNIIFMV